MVKNKRIGVWIQRAAVVAALWGLAVGAHRAQAQGTTEEKSTAQIVKELEEMKQRMAQLEAALAQQKAKEEAAQKEAAVAKAAAQAKADAEAKRNAILAGGAVTPADSDQASREAAAKTVKAIAALPAGHAPDTAERDAEPAQDQPQQAGAPAAPPTTPPVDLQTPFAFADFTWMNAVPRNHDSVLDGKYFSGEFRVDTNYMYDYAHPIDHTLSGTTEGVRTGEFVLQQLNVGGDFHAGNMQGRILTQIGAVATATPRNDASYSQGQWQLQDAYRYIT
jgi:hypothetical protein